MPNAWHFDWTAERVAELTRLWCALGWSAGEIAREFGGALSRNAVIGKVHRLGLKRGFHAPSVRIPPHRRPTALPPEPPHAPFTIRIEDLKYFHCRWPEGDGPPFLYCGARCRPDSSYCEEHFRRAHSRAAP